jgi:hypothetical protein
MLGSDEIEAFVRAGPNLRLVAIDGLPASGKSTLAQRLAVTIPQARRSRGMGDREWEWEEMFLPSVALYLRTNPMARADLLVAGRMARLGEARRVGSASWRPGTPWRCACCGWRPCACTRARSARARRSR